jgi:DNA-binding MarR family transcriptional regulator
MDARRNGTRPDISPQQLLLLIDAVSRASVDTWSAAGRSIALQGNDLSVLAHLVTAGPMTGVQVGAVSGLASSSVTALADRLEFAGMITRTRDDDDRRSIRLTPTAKGRRAVNRVLDPARARLAAILGTLTNEDRERLTRFLTDTTAALSVDGNGSNPARPARVRE